MATDEQLQDKISELRNKGQSYKAIGKMIGVSGMLVWKVEHGECSSTAAREYFGMPPLVVEVTPCECGEVHTKKTCPKKRAGKGKRHRISLEFETAEQLSELVFLMWGLENTRKKQSEYILFLAREAYNEVLTN